MKPLRFIFLIIFSIALITSAKCQDVTIARLRTELNYNPPDSLKFGILDSLCIYYIFCSDKIDSAYFYANENIQMSFPLADKTHLILAYARMGSYYYFAAKFGAALQTLNKGISLSEQMNCYTYSSFLYLTIAETYTFLGQYKKANSYLEKAISYLQLSKDAFYNIPARTYDAFAVNYLFGGQFDSASIYLEKVQAHFTDHINLVSQDMYLGWMAMLKTHYKQYDKAKQFSLKGIDAIKKNDDHQTSDFIYYQYAVILQNTNQLNESIAVAKIGFAAATAVHDIYFMVPITKIISDNYDKLGKKDSTLFYLKLYADYAAQLNSARNVSDVEAAEFSEELHLQETSAQNILIEEKDKNRSRQFTFAVGLIVLVSVSLIMWRNSVNRKKAFAILSQQKAEIELQKAKTEQTLMELKATQTQLIQSEKMASLGELTAGIAHEIQNPLNFVNNFSDVSNELIDELKNEKTKPRMERDEDLIDEVLSDLQQNLAKITHHGKRADAIVKGMLQHSRSSTGVKELTDVNTLADEYLKLAYHGLRAKDKEFNATMQTDFDESIGKINIIPQDIGRVLLNLYNNAFYAVKPPATKGEHGDPSTKYKPIVTVSTRLITLLSGGRGVEIKVSDNGSGIPQNIVDKIFQPFFTTKPTGQGTGLGLSLSYDIIKAHGGEIKVETKENEGTTFIIQLPIS